MYNPGIILKYKVYYGLLLIKPTSLFDKLKLLLKNAVYKVTIIRSKDDIEKDFIFKTMDHNGVRYSATCPISLIFTYSDND